MARMKGLGVGREKTFPIRLNMKERIEMKRAAKSTGLSESDYVRCRIFGYSYESLGGTVPKGVKPTPVPSNPAP